MHFAFVVIGLVVAAICSIGRPNRCGFCGAFFKRVHYKWTVRDEEVFLCPNCNAKMDKMRSDVAFDLAVQASIPEIRFPHKGTRRTLEVIEKEKRMVLIMTMVVVILAIYWIISALHGGTPDV